MVVSMALGALAAYGLYNIVFRIKLWKPWALLSCMLLLSCIPLLGFMKEGLSEYVGSYFPDAWNYILYAQYLWDGEPTNTPIYAQFVASGMSGTRFASSAWLAFFSNHQIDAFAGQGPYLAWLIFVLSASCAALGLAVWRIVDWRIGAVALFGAVSPAVVGTIQTSNFDTLLAASLAPAITTVVLLSKPESWRLACFSGVLSGAVFCAQVEVLPFALMIPVIVLVTFTVSNWKGWMKWSVIALASFLAVSWPWIGRGYSFLLSQVGHLRTGQLPGDQYYLTMNDIRCAIPSAWVLYDVWNSCVGIAWGKLIFSLGMSALFLIGAVVLFLRLAGLVAGASAVGALAALVVIAKGYPYPAFKMIAMMTGVVAVFVVHGAHQIGKVVGRQSVAFAICAALFVGFIVNAIDRSANLKRLVVQKSIEDYRWLERQVWDLGSLKIDVKEPNRFIWTVYFLRNAKLDPSVYELPLFSHAAALPNRPSTEPAKLVVTDKECERPRRSNGTFWICEIP